MNDRILKIERELKSKSADIIWTLISTPEGMAKWIADSVRRNGNEFIFTWGNTAGKQETRTAVIIEEKKYDFIRLKWENGGDSDAIWEMKLDKGDITDDYILSVTDVAADGDIDTLEDIWNANFEVLHRNTGL